MPIGDRGGDERVVGGPVGHVVSRAATLALAAACFVSCGTSVTLENDESGGQLAERINDPCEAIEIGSCCEAGCEIAYDTIASGDPRDRSVEVCVSKNRLCYVEEGCGLEEYHASCPPGYACAKASHPCRSQCDMTGEYEATVRGYCMWTGR